ncbi:hypothetical protein JZ751_022247 [Albula glossodonta]|uniref:Uncharacterized protein n=1 Tax=Albula glossodonta TaxID=121402 RepID=A0A8T2NIU2_9TELE|nr:hypothetical protein JZ751_022247 [Albula glossodonta]
MVPLPLLTSLLQNESIQWSQLGRGDVGLLKEECRTLKEECQMLKEDNRKLSERLQQLHLQRTGSGDAYLALKEEDDPGEKEAGGEAEEKLGEADSYISVAPPRTNCRLVDASIQKNISFEGKPVTPTSWNGGFAEIFSLRDQLKQAEEKASEVQRACEALKAELAELQGLYDTSQSERAELERELQRCREELEQLTGQKGQVRGVVQAKDLEGIKEFMQVERGLWVIYFKEWGVEVQGAGDRHDPCVSRLVTSPPPSDSMRTQQERRRSPCPSVACALVCGFLRRGHRLRVAGQCVCVLYGSSYLSRSPSLPTNSTPPSEPPEPNDSPDEKSHISMIREGERGSEGDWNPVLVVAVAAAVGSILRSPIMTTPSHDNTMPLNHNLLHAPLSTGPPTTPSRPILDIQQEAGNRKEGPLHLYIYTEISTCSSPLMVVIYKHTTLELPARLSSST